ncbi:MAG: hypothetical protein GEU80_07155 [Dehalococcoidia bacterium]|nr:hypothetical protein [Dehalococcoidia bacterium]
MIGGRGAGYALLGLAGLLLAIAIASGWNGASRLVSREDDTDAVAAAASAFVSAYGTFDFRDQVTYTTRLATLTTGTLREAIGAAALDPAATPQQRSITTAVETVSVTALSKQEATVVVTALQERRWVDPTLRQSLHEQVRQRVICRLVVADGRWLVAELRLQSEQPARPEAR